MNPTVDRGVLWCVLLAKFFHLPRMLLNISMVNILSTYDSIHKLWKQEQPMICRSLNARTHVKTR